MEPAKVPALVTLLPTRLCPRIIHNLQEEKVLLVVAEPTEAVALSARNVENLSVNRGALRASHALSSHEVDHDEGHALLSTLPANITSTSLSVLLHPPAVRPPSWLTLRPPCVAEAIRIYDLLNADRIVVESRALDFLNAQFGLDLDEEEPQVDGELSHTAA